MMYNQLPIDDEQMKKDIEQIERQCSFSTETLKHALQTAYHYGYGRGQSDLQKHAKAIVDAGPTEVVELKKSYLFP
jgi:hypothetical protein